MLKWLQEWCIMHRTTGLLWVWQKHTFPRSIAEAFSWGWLCPPVGGVGGSGCLYSHVYFWCCFGLAAWNTIFSLWSNLDSSLPLLNFYNMRLKFCKLRNKISHFIFTCMFHFCSEIIQILIFTHPIGYQDRWIVISDS